MFPGAFGRVRTRRTGSPESDGRLAPDLVSALRRRARAARVGLHKLRGDRKDQWAMTVNGPWRICFEFRKGDAYNVELVDYRKG